MAATNSSHHASVLMTACLCVAAVASLAETVPDLVPMPKVYRPLEGAMPVDSAAVFIADGDRQGAIAAEELAKRIAELGGKPGLIQAAKDASRPGIYVLPAANGVGQKLLREERLDVTGARPGPQGYAIRVSGERAVVVGSDSVGALYGAMTLRQMMGVKDGRVSLPAAAVFDRPDYRYRTGVEFRRGIERYMAAGEPDALAGYKAAIDWMLHFKLNMIGNFIGLDPRSLDEAGLDRIRAINAYATERGVYPIEWGGTAIAYSRYDTGEEFSNWPCVHYTKAGMEVCYCWCRDELARQMATRVADYLQDCHFRLFFLHPKDGGGISDPEIWSKRCEQCRKRWGDDERWKASIHQYNLWSEVFAERAPDVVISSPIYPYAASYASRARFPDVSEEVWRQNSVDYWAHLHRGIDRKIVPMTWMSTRSLMDEYRSRWMGRPVCIYAHSFVALGYFGTFHRNCKTNSYGHPEDIFYLAAGGCLAHSEWMNLLCGNEFAWNTLAPGHETYAGLYYDAETDHTGPAVVMDEWVPRACRAFFGKAVGEAIAPIYTAGVQPYYIMNPGQGIARANKMRRRPLADVDPTKNQDEGDVGKPVAGDIIDSAERMGSQVRATKAAMEALELARKHVATLDQYKQRVLNYYYRRMPLWHLTAQARHACYLAGDLQRQGNYSQAADVLNAGLAAFEEDSARVHAILEKTKNEPDLARLPPLHPRNRDILETPTPDQVKVLLEQRLASASVVLKPRRAGPVIRVAVHRGLGEQGTKAFLDGFANVEAEIIDSLSLAVLDRFDCVFILQTTSVNRDDYFHGLARYVKQGGGGVLFQHDMCGRPKRGVFGEKTPFPEVCSSAPGRTDARRLVVSSAHESIPGAKVGDVHEHMYYDHLELEPGPKGTVVAADEAGAPVVIAGEAGLGKVIFDGNVNLTASDQDELLTGFNAILAKGAVEWFTGVTLRK